jgi:L-aminopeptidase/D-esterase-like protein
MRRRLERGGLRAAALGAILVAGAAVAADQAALEIATDRGERRLALDWPALRIGTAEYRGGPTGVTVFHFPQRALAAVDVRGGGPGTVNTDYLRLGYEIPELDAVVFAGGSWYGLESVTAVATALKDDGMRSGNWDNLALAVGAIIYDLGDRRLNEIYPDKRLAQAAFRAARSGSFPLGAEGAGRFARTGALVRCNAYSGQGGAYRQIGDVKLAAFAVVNALGVVTKRDGRVAACYPRADWPADLRATELMAQFPESAAQAPAGRNTTVSLVVTSQKLTYARLQRLAVQVHTSMARALQPFATEADGDVLYAVSTGEVDAGAKAMSTFELGIAASELMWDAVLSSVPEQPPAKVTAGPPLPAAALRRYAGEYEFSPFAKVAVTVSGATLSAQATGQRDVYAIGRDVPVSLVPVALGEFAVPGRYPLRLRFDGEDELVINPGHWAQTGRRIGSGN